MYEWLVFSLISLEFHLIRNWPHSAAPSSTQICPRKLTSEDKLVNWLNSLGQNSEKRSMFLTCEGAWMSNTPDVFLFPETKRRWMRRKFLPHWLVLWLAPRPCVETAFVITGLWYFEWLQCDVGLLSLRSPGWCTFLGCSWCLQLGAGPEGQIKAFLIPHHRLRCSEMINSPPWFAPSKTCQ